MKALREQGFWGAGLILVRTPSMVRRYNDCLEDLGIEKTALKSFQIDGIGWSPQIAEEKGKTNYLSHGEANQFAIILTPDQEGKPIYMPAHSFDYSLMKSVWGESKKQIANLTTRTGLWLDIDQQIDHYHSPLDLEMLEGIRVRATTTERTIVAAKRQRELVSQFREENDLWMDSEARSELVESAKKYGDLRYKPCIVPEIPYSDVASFYSRAFGGMFLFREMSGFFRGKLMILEDTARYEDLIKKEAHVYGIDDEILYQILVKKRLAVIGLEWYRGNPTYLNRLKENMLAEAIYLHGDQDFNLADANAGQRKRILSELSDHLPPEYFEIDSLRKAIGSTDVKEARLSKRLARLLVRPHTDLPEKLKPVVWMILMKLRPHSVENLYQFSKQQFYESYQEWPEEKRRWARAFLQKMGLPNKD